jgi:hypothetical protein
MCEKILKVVMLEIFKILNPQLLGWAFVPCSVQYWACGAVTHQG